MTRSKSLVAVAVMPLLRLSCASLRGLTDTPSDARQPTTVSPPTPAVSRTIAPTFRPSYTLGPAPTKLAISAPFRPAL